MEDHSRKDLQNIIGKLTHPVSITEGNRSIVAHTETEPGKTNFLSIFTRNSNEMVLYKNFQLEEIKDSCTQTSKTIIELAKIETGEISPDSLSISDNYEDEAEEINPDESCNSIIDSDISKYVTFDPGKHFNSPVEPLQLNLIESDSSRTPSLIETFLRKSKTKVGKDYGKYLAKNSFKSQSCVDPHHDSDRPHCTKFTVKNMETIEGEKSFMMPTLSSKQKNLLPQIREANTLFLPLRRGRSSSPKPKGNMIENRGTNVKVPYIDQSESEASIRKETKDNLITRITLANRQVAPKQIPTPSLKTFSKDMLRIDEMSLILVPTENNSATCFSDPTNSIDSMINGALSMMQNHEWNIALRGLAEITEMCKSPDVDMMPYMVTVNQKLLQLLKSPRSHVCRTACQAAGHLFESMKYTRGPEFNDIVDILLTKTADANKFIRKDANLSLDCMVTHVATAHAIKALCLKGPSHKNNLVRTATVRLLICAIVIAGPSVILNPNTNEPTRRRIFTNLVKFLEDKNPDTRKYGERLYKVLSRERYFDRYLKKYIDRDDLSRIKQTLKALSQK